MFVFDGTFGRVLHTGDFRYGGPIPDDILPFVGTINTLFLDCTYGHPSFNFATQEDARDSCIRTIQNIWRAGKGDDVFIAADNLGKEELYAAIARACRTRVLVDHARYLSISRGDPTIAHLFAPPPPSARADRHLLALPSTVPASQAAPRGYTPAIRVVPWWAVTERGLQKWSDRTGRNARAVLPTGCGSRLRGAPGTYVSYTSHSSFKELASFVRALRPQSVAPTPETAHYTAQDGLSRDPATWFSSFLVARPVSTAYVRVQGPLVHHGLSGALVRLVGSAKRQPSSAPGDAEDSTSALLANKKRRRGGMLSETALAVQSVRPRSARLTELMEPALGPKSPPAILPRGKKLKQRSSIAGDIGSLLQMPVVTAVTAESPEMSIKALPLDEGKPGSVPARPSAGIELVTTSNSISAIGLVDRNGAPVMHRMSSPWF